MDTADNANDDEVIDFDGEIKNDGEGFVTLRPITRWRRRTRGSSSASRRRRCWA